MDAETIILESKVADVVCKQGLGMKHALNKFIWITTLCREDCTETGTTEFGVKLGKLRRI